MYLLGFSLQLSLVLLVGGLQMSHCVSSGASSSLPPRGDPCSSVWGAGVSGGSPGLGRRAEVRSGGIIAYSTWTSRPGKNITALFLGSANSHSSPSSLLPGNSLLSWQHQC